MKYIGDALIKDQQLSKENFLECMIEKVESVPHLSRVVHEKKLLSVNEQLMVFKHLSEKSSSYKEACESLNLWSDRIESEVTSFIQQKHKTLSEILVSKSYLNWDQLMNAFDRALNEENGGSDEEAESTAVKSESRPDEKKKTGDKSKFISLYQNYFDEEKYNQIIKSFGYFGNHKQDKEAFKSWLEDLKSMLFEVFSSAEFIEAEQSIRLLGGMIDCVNKLADLPEDKVDSLIAPIEDGFSIVWEMRNNIVSTGEELDGDEKIAERIENTLNGLSE